MCAFGTSRRALGALSTVVATLVAGVAPVFAAAASDVRLVRSGIAHDMLFDLAFEGQNGVAVGSYGSVLLSDDGGGAWRLVDAPGDKVALLGTAISAGRCLAVGQGGTVLVADDCSNWRAAESGSSERLMAVGLNANGLAYAVGAFGTVLHSADGGNSWDAVELDWSALSPTGAEPHLYDVHVSDDGAVTLVGEFGLILRGRHGDDWRIAHAGEQSLFGLSVTGDTAYAVGQGGVVLASDDGNETWRVLDSGSSAILTGVWSDGAGRVIASGLNTILQSEDGGRSWRQSDAGAHANAAHLAVAASQSAGGGQRVLMVGSAAAVLELLQ
jgi:photosystem II stability/assembly factor-like uncharacterized protein